MAAWIAAKAGDRLREFADQLAYHHEQALLLGREMLTLAGTCVILIVQDHQIRIINTITGELLRELVLDPERDYQPTGAPKGPTRK